MKDQSVAKKSVILACVMLLAAALVLVSASAVNAEKPDRVNGLKPVFKDVYKVPGAKKSSKKMKKEAAPPELKYYRSDEQEWASGIRVKNQLKSGLCWAFSITTAAEYSYAKESYEKSGMVKETSPGHLGWFFYNRVNDPLGQTAGDKNLTTSDYTWVQGGDQIYGMQHLATWSGLAPEGAPPNDFDSLINKHIDSSSGEWIGTKHPYSDDKAYDDYVTQEECIMYPAPAGTSKETIKNLVYKYGAVSTGLVFDWKNYMNCDEKDGNGIKYPDGRSFYNYSGNNNMNHAVTIIGWDDNYPKENFTHTKDADGKRLSYFNDEDKETDCTDEEAAALTTPAHNGAWIVQNSWGEGEHDNGIFYVSYYSCGQSNDNGKKANCYSDVSVYDMQPADTYKYNFQYDGTADSGDSSQYGNKEFFTDAGTRAANVFNNTINAPITLEAVGFTTYNDGETAYTIKVYTGLKNPDNPESGTLKGTTKYKTYTPGAKTAVLDKPVYVGEGKSYSIVFEFSQETHFGVEKKAISDDYEVETAKGQSFFRPADSDPVSGIVSGIVSGNNNWEDIYNENKYKSACFRIKGFANPVSTTVYHYKSLYFRLDEKNKCLEVTGCDKGLSGDVVIPDALSYDGVNYPVTAISEGAFKGESSITSVTLPDTMTQISEDAFVNTGLSKILIPRSVTTIEDHAIGYSSEKKDGAEEYSLVPGFTIQAVAGTEGAKYAERNGITYEVIKDKVQEEAEAAEAARKAEEARKEKERKAAEAKKARISRAKAAKVKIKDKALKKKKVRLTWNKAGNVSGYEVYKAAKKNAKFKKAAVLKANAVSWKSGKIKKGKKAFFKVRPFTVISGSKVYGKWSNVAKVKLKK